MKYFRKELIALPDTSDGWTEVSIGCSLTEMRVLSYASIAAFFLVNGACLYLMGFAYFDGFTRFVKQHSTLAVTAYVIGGQVFYYALHEAVHVLFHPDRGRSDKTMVGMQAAAFFVLYNGEIGKRRLQTVRLPAFISPCVSPEQWLPTCARAC